MRALFEKIGSLDLRSLAILRIAYGLLLLTDLAGRALDLRAHYTDWGVVPRSDLELLASPWPSLCVHLLSGSALFQGGLFFLHALAALALTLGYRTRLVGPLAWFLLISLQGRNPLVCDGGDNYLRVVFFWCLFLPWGARLAVRPERSPVQSRFAGICYLLQICLIYWFAVALKTGSDWRQDGSAVYYTLMIDQLATPLAPWLLAHPTLMKFLSFATLGLEGFAPLLLWIPGLPRLLAIVALGCLHLGFGLFLHLGLFSWIGAVSCWGLLPGFVWRGPEDRAPPPERGLYGVLAYPMLLVLQWNFLGLGGFNPRYRLWDWPLKVVRLDQSWSMFAPRPRREDGWYVIEADLENETRVDLWRPQSPLSWSKPARVAGDYANARWRRYMMTICFPEATPWRLSFGRYLTRSWNDSHLPGKRVKAFRVYFLLECTTATGTLPVQKVLLWTHDCKLKGP